MVDKAGLKGPADHPRYGFKDAERATDVPASTIGVWVRGQRYNQGKAFFEPLIERPDPSDPRLSFNNLLEINVLRSLRRVDDVKVSTVRQAISQARQEHGIDRLLIDPRLCTSGGRLFLDYIFQLVDLSESDQLAIEVILRQSLKRVDISAGSVRAYFPVPRTDELKAAGARPIVVSPYFGFGNAVIERRGCSTHAIRARIDAKEPAESVIKDYGLTQAEFDEAILYEAAA